MLLVCDRESGGDTEDSMFPTPGAMIIAVGFLIRAEMHVRLWQMRHEWPPSPPCQQPDHIGRSVCQYTSPPDYLLGDSSAYMG
ncbi:hypothetical protein P170DRAFT_440264 [Aspergillus steynii IBT 23096]|uniref:Uncharacterized protein n=1 Tax=Aspergillus steynii IBT 23096 TaxID=1392250 RepID=A0A2I2FWZ0_9EURO|nr:uncharacterized protein P170DRAFT_440264 [Aspergillus steynii IBT 23096]PLB45127.1 hypothetical protein P170DRAFT_440264 [Aspergillus steynii IBT 23096]